MKPQQAPPEAFVEAITPTWERLGEAQSVYRGDASRFFAEAWQYDLGDTWRAAIKAAREAIEKDGYQGPCGCLSALKRLEGE